MIHKIFNVHSHVTVRAKPFTEYQLPHSQEPWVKPNHTSSRTFSLPQTSTRMHKRWHYSHKTIRTIITRKHKYTFLRTARRQISRITYSLSHTNLEEFKLYPFKTNKYTKKKLKQNTKTHMQRNLNYTFPHTKHKHPIHTFISETKTTRVPVYTDDPSESQPGITPFSIVL